VRAGLMTARSRIKGDANGRADTVKRVAYYVRISTDEDRQKYSLDGQRDRLEAFCRGVYGESGYTVVEVYRDTESGAHLNRPGLQRMLADAEAGGFDELIVFRVDRLSRKLNDLGPMVERLIKHRVTFRSVSESFDTASPSGRAMMQLLGVFGELERETIIERTKVGMERKARTGLWVSGAVPYGYRRDAERKTLVMHEGEAGFIHRLFSTYASGREGVWTLRSQFTAMGLRKRSGKPWDRRCLLHMLRNVVYAGKVRWNGELYDGTHEPIVTEDLFDRVQAILQGRSDIQKGRHGRVGSVRFLTGIIRCGLCDGGMVGVSTQKKGKKHSYYACLTREREKRCDQEYVRADELEAIVLRDVKTLFRDDAFVDRVWEETNRRLAEQAPDLDRELEAASAERERVVGKIDRYTEAFEAGNLDAGLFGENVRALKEQLLQIETHRGDLEAQAANLRLPALDRAHILALLDDFETVFDSGTNAQRKHLLHQVVKEVRVHGRLSVEVTYFVPQPGPGGSPVMTQPHMAPEVGLEPTTLRLTAGCSAIELLRNGGVAEPRAQGPGSGQIGLRR
jgi:site-specific DNA recombinase